MTRLYAAMFFAFLAAAPAVAQEARLPAFPGAEGFGMYTQGGRGGDVFFVTNLHDYKSGEDPVEGSLRAAVAAEGPRTIVFRVSGHVELERELEITEPYLTIAGQTAPGEGISIKNYGIDVAAPEVIIRHIRVRPGDVSGEELDAINIRSRNVIVDHCSATWATDETVSIIGDATDVTVQWCLIAESLNESVHSKGEHGYGSLISTSGNVSVHHNIYAFHKSRNPRPRHTLLDFRNNVIYGWSGRAGYNADDRTRMNYVGNYLHPLDYSDNDGVAFSVGGNDTRIFLEDNLLRRPDGRVRSGWELIKAPPGPSDMLAESSMRVGQPFPTPTVSTIAAEDLLDRLLAEAGATRPALDAADERILKLIAERSGAIINSQDEVGGWPHLAGGAAPADTDNDGMPDDWEARYGLDPRDGSDHREDLDGDGYTNLEEFLNDTDPTAEFGWESSPAIQPENGATYTTAPLFVTMEPRGVASAIHYTTDGSEPTKESDRYEGPIRIFGDAHVRALAAVDDLATTAAFAAYEKLEWMPAQDAVSAELAPGLVYSVYEADDWDEGVVLDSLEPIRTGAAEFVDFGLRPQGGWNAIVFDGGLEIPEDGIYAFYFEDDVRSELRIDGLPIAQGSPPGLSPARVALRKGRHRFHLRSLHEEPREPALEWSGPGFDRAPINGRFYFHIPQLDDVSTF